MIPPKTITLLSLTLLNKHIYFVVVVQELFGTNKLNNNIKQNVMLFRIRPSNKGLSKLVTKEPTSRSSFLTSTMKKAGCLQKD